MVFNGILNIDKPAGITSQTAVTRVKHLLAGHSGTLDPLATGVLPVMVGTAVKASDWLTGHDKRYIAGIRLGVETDSEDITGRILYEHKGALPSFEEFCSAVQSFTGRILQIPPMYSAIKKDGKKLVDLARKGISVERAPREIEIYSITASSVGGELYLDVFCSKGTYIRTLCADIGRELGCGAAMSSLRRTAAGCFSIENSIPLDQLSNIPPEEIATLLTPTEHIFCDYEKITLPPFYERLFKNGASVSFSKIGIDTISKDGLYRVYDENSFFALAETVIYEGLPALKVKKFFK